MKLTPRWRALAVGVALVAFVAAGMGQVYVLFHEWAVALFGLGLAALALLVAFDGKP